MTDRDSSSLQRPIRSAKDVEELSARDRSLLARWLAHSAQCDDIVVSPFRRRIGLAMTFGGVVLLVPWVAVLATTLDRHSAPSAARGRADVATVALH
jgi:hypothetical protein